MASRLRRSLTFANVCSFLALTIALGTGSAYAANTVFSTDIVDGEVKTADIGQRGRHLREARPNSIGNAQDQAQRPGHDKWTSTPTRSTARRCSTPRSPHADLANDAVNRAAVSTTSLTSRRPRGAGHSSEIATDAVNATEIADDAIDSGEIVNGSLLEAPSSPTGAVGTREL